MFILRSFRFMTTIRGEKHWEWRIRLPKKECGPFFPLESMLIEVFTMQAACATTLEYLGTENNADNIDLRGWRRLQGRFAAT